MDDLPNEYIARHRDQDFLFAAEFEVNREHNRWVYIGQALPQLLHSTKQPTVAADRKENSRKNRYNDIKCFDSNRVKLKPTHPSLEYTDYINASFIRVSICDRTTMYPRIAVVFGRQDVHSGARTVE
jgi:protein tyrosine phosphatase